MKAEIRIKENGWVSIVIYTKYRTYIKRFKQTTKRKLKRPKSRQKWRRYAERERESGK